VLNSCRIWSPTPPHPLPTTYCLYILYFDFWKGEERWGRLTREKVRGVEKTVFPVYKLY
jgi:hypothetical protein